MTAGPASDRARRGDSLPVAGYVARRHAPLLEATGDPAVTGPLGLQKEAVAFCHERGVADVRTFIARGHGWKGALAGVKWDDHDLLVLGSSRLGAFAGCSSAPPRRRSSVTRRCRSW